MTGGGPACCRPKRNSWSGYAVNYVLNECFDIPAQQHSAAAVLKRIYERWKINPGLYESKAYYVTVLA